MELIIAQVWRGAERRRGEVSGLTTVRELDGDIVLLGHCLYIGPLGTHNITMMLVGNGALNSDLGLLQHIHTPTKLING